MDIPDDLSGMADPVPHYRDIKATDTARDQMHRAASNAINISVVLGTITWVVWGISVIIRWVTA